MLLRWRVHEKPWCLFTQKGSKVQEIPKGLGQESTLADQEDFPSQVKTFFVRETVWLSCLFGWPRGFATNRSRSGGTPKLQLLGSWLGRRGKRRHSTVRSQSQDCPCGNPFQGKGAMIKYGLELFIEIPINCCELLAGEVCKRSRCWCSSMHWMHRTVVRQPKAKKRRWGLRSWTPEIGI